MGSSKGTQLCYDVIGVPAYHGIKNDTTAPEVCFEPFVGESAHHFGSGVAGAAAGRVQFLARVVVRGETEVNYLDLEAVIEQDVFGLQVAVNDAEHVHVFDCVHELEEEAASFAFFKSLLAHYVLEEFPAGRELHDEVKVEFGLDNLS